MQPNVKEWDRGRQISVPYLEGAPQHDPVEPPPPPPPLLSAQELRIGEAGNKKTMVRGRE